MKRERGDRWVGLHRSGQKILWMLMTQRVIIFQKSEDDENVTEEVKTLKVS